MSNPYGGPNYDPDKLASLFGDVNPKETEETVPPETVPPETVPPGEILSRNQIAFTLEVVVFSPLSQDSVDALKVTIETPALKDAGYVFKEDGEKPGSFVVYKQVEGQTEPVQVLKGNENNCEMSSPLDAEILKAYIDAHKPKPIIVDNCGTKEAAQQLLKACKEAGVDIKFPAGKLEEFGIGDDYFRIKHSSPPKEDKQPGPEAHIKNRF